MGNFEEHLQYGILSVILTFLLVFAIGYAFVWPYQFAFGLLPIAIGFTIFGSLLPDIDHHNSRPYKTVQTVIPVTIGVISLGFLWLYFPEINQQLYKIWNPNRQLVALFGFILAISSVPLTKLFIEYLRPPHRGITHTLTFTVSIAILTFILTCGLFTLLDMSVSLILSGAFVLASSIAIGILSHLYCDDMILKNLSIN